MRHQPQRELGLPAAGDLKQKAPIDSRIASVMNEALSRQGTKAPPPSRSVPQPCHRTGSLDCLDILRPTRLLRATARNVIDALTVLHLVAAGVQDHPRHQMLTP